MHVISYGIRKGAQTSRDRQTMPGQASPDRQREARLSEGTCIYVISIFLFFKDEKTDITFAFWTIHVISIFVEFFKEPKNVLIDFS